MRRLLSALVLVWALPASAQPATPCPIASGGVWEITPTTAILWICASDGLSWIAIGGSGGASAWGDITGTLGDQTDLQSALDAKQATLVSATNIKTINGSTVLGSGDLTVAGAAAWGSVTGTLSSQTDLQTALDGKASTAHAATHLSGGSDPLAAATTAARGTVELATDGESAASVAVQGNDARMSNARTPTAHATSHVTGGSDIIANAVAAGNAGLLTGADKTKLDAQSGTNTGDQTSIVGITGTLAQFNTALTGADFASGGGTATGTNTGDQTSIVGITGTLAQFNTAITDADLATGGGTATGTNTGDQTITLTGNVTGTGTGSFAATIANGAVTLAKQADMASASVVYRKTGGAGAPEVQTLATLKTDLGLTGTNSGDQTITLTGDVTGTGTGSFATTIKTSVILTTPVLGVATATSVVATGALSSSGTAGVGYTLGAGGAVTQLTSKATATPAINKPCGTITMHNAALAAAAIVTFVVTNNTVAATDVWIVQHDSVGTFGAYGIWPNTNSAGVSFKITIKNISAGSLSEAIVLRFCRITGAVS